MRQETLTISASAMLQTSKLELVHKFWFLRKMIIQYRVSQKNVLIEKIIAKIECCGAKFFPEHDLGALHPA